MASTTVNGCGRSDHPEDGNTIAQQAAVSQGQEAAMAELRRGLVDDPAGTLAAAVPNWLRPDASPALVDWIIRQILDSGVFIDELILGW